jgi:hypothetical protein
MAVMAIERTAHREPAHGSVIDVVRAAHDAAVRQAGRPAA